MVKYIERVNGKECYNEKGYYIGSIFPYGYIRNTAAKYKYQISLINGHYDVCETLEKAKQEIERIAEKGLF